MILVDYSGLAVSAILGALHGKRSSVKDADEALLKHIIINGIRDIHIRFREKYGKMIICGDKGASWRKKLFPNYKCKRSISKETSSINWDMVFKSMNDTYKDLQMFFPYHCIRIESLEADDIIAILAKNIDEKKHIIYSKDHDFFQLISEKIDIFNPYTKKLKTIKNSDNPELVRREHIIRGDFGDSVPNFLSDDDVFINKEKRQKSIRETHVQNWLSLSENDFIDTLSDEHKRNYFRNKHLVDLSMIPKEYVDNILKEFIDSSEEKANNNFSSNKLMNYFIANKMKMFFSCINDFTPKQSGKQQNVLTNFLN